MRPLLCPSLVGREAELARLTGALDQAGSAGGGVVFLTGEAGSANPGWPAS